MTDWEWKGKGDFNVPKIIQLNRYLTFLQDASKVVDFSDNFVPDPLPESNLYTVLKPYTTWDHKLFLGSDGRGNVKLVKMENFQNNPTAEALFVFHRIED